MKIISKNGLPIVPKNCYVCKWTTLFNEYIFSQANITKFTTEKQQNIAKNQ